MEPCCCGEGEGPKAPTEAGGHSRCQRNLLEEPTGAGPENRWSGTSSAPGPLLSARSHLDTELWALWVFPRKALVGWGWGFSPSPFP